MPHSPIQYVHICIWTIRIETKQCVFYNMKWIFLPTYSCWQRSSLVDCTMNTESSSNEHGAQQALDFVRAVFGWHRSPSDVVQAATMFRNGWINDAVERQKTRGLALNIIRDTVSRMSKSCCHDNWPVEWHRWKDWTSYVLSGQSHFTFMGNVSLAVLLPQSETSGTM